MALYPQAQKWLLPQNAPGSGGSQDIIPCLIILHTNASNSTLESLYHYWYRNPDGTSAANGNEANFDLEVGTAHGGKGRLGQFMDTTRRGDSTGAANAFTRNGKVYGAVSIESGDLGPPYDKSWTDLGQRQQLEDLLVWLCQTHGIRPVLAVPNPAGGWDGIGYHAQPPYHDQWNIHDHVCPGPGKIAEVPDLIAAVARRISPKGTAWDFLFFPGTPEAIAGAGVKHVGRYSLSSGGMSGVIDKAELDHWHSLGVGVFLIHESGKTAWRNGTTWAKTQGAKARAYARSIGWPDERPIVCADFDENIPTTNFPTALAYMQAWNAGGGQGLQTAYGEGALLVYLRDHGAIRFGFQSASTSYPGNSTISPATNLLQTTRASYSPPFQPGSYDEDYPITEDFGQHPAPLGADMPLTDDDVQRVAKAVAEYMVPASATIPAAQLQLLTRDGRDLAGQARNAANTANSTAGKAATQTSLDNLAEALNDRLSALEDAIAAIPTNAPPGSGATVADIKGLLQQTGVPSVPGNLQPPP